MSRSWPLCSRTGQLRRSWNRFSDWYARCRIAACDARLNDAGIVNPITIVIDTTIAVSIDAVGNTPRAVSRDRVIASGRLNTIVEARESHVVYLKDRAFALRRPNHYSGADFANIKPALYQY